MLTNRESAETTTESKRFLVKCESCAFEHTVADRDEAAVIGSDHQRETRHEVVALEVPPAFDRS
ncbi:hypothetical protein [Natronolimnohabitans innermongolicus]|uniref:Uncharacterized protein n=1 Tax=Natronolimnohabitans innermongolicus JCM 12255 TaxID=1227499 RepID=L9XHG5_9EURY|nr:hypothetical protein [Natronolimnohabitans innermongolicus]ELY61184.1 hypothetical protein C493_02683 [Natronolimnohabitans innermongolicus JCM 12255]